MVNLAGLVVLRFGALAALCFCTMVAYEYYGPGEAFCAAGSGCDAVRFSSVGRDIAAYLPALGILAFTTVFVASLFAHRNPQRIARYGAVAGGLVAAALLALQGGVIHAWCALCVGVDVSAIVAALGGAVLLAAARRSAEPSVRFAAGPPWMIGGAWALLWPAAFGPVATVLAFPDPAVPEAVRELWDPDAPVNIVEMADFECPYCRAMHPVLQEAIATSGENVHLARIHYPLRFHAHARNSARAFFCADAQGKGDAMADALFSAEDLSPAGNRRAAEAVGLDLTVYDNCIVDSATEELVAADLARGDRAGMHGLPTVYIGEQTFRGFLPGSGPEAFVAAIRSAARGEGRREHLFPFLLIGGLSLASLTFGWRAHRRQRAAG